MLGIATRSLSRLLGLPSPSACLRRELKRTLKAALNTLPYPQTVNTFLWQVFLDSVVASDVWRQFADLLWQL